MNRPRAGNDETAVALMPAACPFCGSSKVASTSEKKVDSSTYWRCETCGQMWNVGRLQQPSRRGYERR
jgi:transposase-like protein